MKPNLSDADVRFLVSLDERDHVALAAATVDDPDRIIGVARFVRLSEDPAAAEVAIVVGDQFQDQGGGTALLIRLADAARDRGIAHLKATVLAENVPARRLLHHGDAHERHLGPVDEIEIRLAA